MSNSDTPPSRLIFVNYPDDEMAAYVESVIHSTEQGFQVVRVSNLTDLYRYLSEVPDTASVITELMWEEQDASDVLLSMALNFPKISFLALSNHNITEILPPFFPIPYVQGADQLDSWVGMLYSMQEDLRGTQISNFRINYLVGQSQQARIYSANQLTINRDVHLMVLPSNSTEEDKLSFRRIAAARAANIHPVIYAIYEEGEDADRTYVAQEPINAPTLLQLSIQNTTFDSRTLARIINVTATTIKHHQSRSIPYQPLRSSHITYSSEGVIKLLNTALPEEEALPDEQEQLYALAQFLQDFVSPEETLNPSLFNLMSDMSNYRVSADDTATRSNEIDIELAPVKFTPQRAAAVLAEVQVNKARQSFWVVTIAGTVGFALFVTWFITYILSNYVLVPPGRDFNTQFKITAGEVVIGSKKFPVEEFYMDEVEVTIGQYKKFLQATLSRDPDLFLPNEFQGEKKNFIPKDWAAIEKAVKSKNDFLGGAITNDCPIINIDYLDALAYAKWAKKRLPTELEWIRAASGDGQYPYPWGKENDLSKANTGYDSNRTSKGEVAGSIDGYRGMNEVDAKDSDLSPFKIKGLAGNVSEWVQTSPELGSFKTDFRPQKGSNYGIDRLVPNQVRTGGVITTRNPFLGLRCVSNKPVQ